MSALIGPGAGDLDPGDLDEMVALRDEFGLGAAQVWGPDALPAWEVDVLVSAAAQRADAQRGKDGLPGG